MDMHIYVQDAFVIALMLGSLYLITLPQGRG